MAVVTGQIQLFLQGSDGITRNLSLAQDFTSSFLETKDLNMNQAEALKFLETFIMQMKDRVGAQGLQLIVKWRNRLEDPLSQSVPIPLGNDDQPVHLLGLDIPSAVYYRFRIEDSGLTKRWTLQGFSAFGELDGELF